MYKLVFDFIARKEFEESIEWYSERNEKTVIQFINEIDDKIQRIKANPFQFNKKYKSFIEAKLNKFPYTIVIVAIYHQKRDPQNKFRDRYKSL